MLIIFIGVFFICSNIRGFNENCIKNREYIQAIYSIASKNLNKHQKNKHLFVAKIHECVVLPKTGKKEEAYVLYMLQHEQTKDDLFEEKPFFDQHDQSVLPSAFNYFEINLFCPVGIFEIASGLSPQCVELADYITPLQGAYTNWHDETEDHKNFYSCCELTDMENLPLSKTDRRLLRSYFSKCDETQLMS